MDSYQEPSAFSYAAGRYSLIRNEVHFVTFILLFAIIFTMPSRFFDGMLLTSTVLFGSIILPSFLVYGTFIVTETLARNRLTNFAVILAPFLKLAVRLTPEPFATKHFAKLPTSVLIVTAEHLKVPKIGTTATVYARVLLSKLGADKKRQYGELAREGQLILLCDMWESIKYGEFQRDISMQINSVNVVADASSLFEKELRQAATHLEGNHHLDALASTLLAYMRYATLDFTQALDAATIYTSWGHYTKPSFAGEFDKFRKCAYNMLERNETVDREVFDVAQVTS